MSVNNVAEMHNALACNKIGNDANDAGNYTFAVDVFTKSIELNPNDGYTYYCRAGAYSKLSEHDKAIEDYSKAVALNPQDVYSHFLRGNQYSELGDLDKAMEDFNKMIELYPQLAFAYNRRGIAYEIFYTLKEAKTLIEKWRMEYNTFRPHSSLNYCLPAP